MSIDIDELVLCVPGLAAEQARTLGEAVARRVGEALSVTAGARADVGALDLRLKLAPGMAIEQMVEAIADAILTRLR